MDAGWLVAQIRVSNRDRSVSLVAPKSFCHFWWGPRAPLCFAWHSLGAFSWPPINLTYGVKAMSPQYACLLWWYSLAAVQGLGPALATTLGDSYHEISHALIQHHGGSFTDVGLPLPTQSIFISAYSHPQQTLLSQVWAQPVGRSRVWFYGCRRGPTLWYFAATLPSLLWYLPHSATANAYLSRLVSHACPAGSVDGAQGKRMQAICSQHTRGRQPWAIESDVGVSMVSSDRARRVIEEAEGLLVRLTLLGEVSRVGFS